MEETKQKANIVFTGRLTLERLKELAAVHGITQTTQINTPPNNEDHLWNPSKNPQVIAIVKQTDGNYIGATQRNGQVITVRDLVPEHVLTQLLTHA